MHHEPPARDQFGGARSNDVPRFDIGPATTQRGSQPAAASPEPAAAAATPPALYEDDVYGTLDSVPVAVPALALAAVTPTPTAAPSSEPRKMPQTPCAGWLKKLGGALARA